MGRRWLTTDSVTGGGPFRPPVLSPGSRTREHGFTLTEMLVILCVASAMAVIALAAMGWAVPDWKLREASASLASALRSARTKAIIDQDEISVPFDILHGRYTTVGQATAMGVSVETDAEGIVQRVVHLPYGVRFARPDEGTPVTLTPPDSEDKAAVFSTKGRLLSGQPPPGFAYLGNPERGIYRRVSVNVVGTVRVERWNGEDWE